MSDKWCDPCASDNVESKAASWCTDCEEALCPDCTKAHRRNKLSRSHVLIDTQQIENLPSSTVSSQTYCEIHRDLTLDFYCNLHDTTCCRSCMVEIHRSCENVVPLDQASKNIKSAPIIDELTAEIENIINTADRLLSNAEVNLSKLENQKTDILERISQEKKQAIDRFDVVEQSLKDNLSRDKRTIETTIKKDEANINDIQADVNISEQEIDFIGKYSSDVQGYLQLRKVKQDLKIKTKDLEKTVSKIRDMSLSYDKRTDWHVRSLGSVQVEQSKCPVTYSPLHQREAVPSVQASMIKPRTSSLGSLKSNDVPEIPGASIRKGMKLKSGNLVDLWKGTWASIEARKSREVVIKTAKETETSMNHLLAQMAILSNFDHQNVIKMYGVSSGPPLSMVMEYMSQGNLLQLLHKFKNNAENIRDILEELTLIAVKVCDGMEHINSKKIVHTDLSAKNVLIGGSNVTKITGFGMAKYLNNGDTMKMDAAFPVAIKWAAPEMLLEKTINIMSDVWSFGILLIEMMTLGNEPYPGIPKQDLAIMLKKGLRHPMPDGCSDLIYDVLLQCWHDIPEERPTFQFLRNFFDTVEIVESDTTSEADGQSLAASGDYEETVLQSGVMDPEVVLPKKKGSKSKDKEKCSIS